MMEKDEQTTTKILKDFKASEVNIVLAAIELCRKEGNQKTFKALLELLKDTDEPQVEEAVISFLYDLKDQTGIPVLIDAINDDEYSYYHSFLIASFWQAAIDGSDHLEVFVRKAIEGDYMVCLEALTVVENFDAAYSEEEIEDFVYELEEAIGREENPDKKGLLVSLSDVIRNLPIEGE